jgi:hypothetical protein
MQVPFGLTLPELLNLVRTDKEAKWEHVEPFEVDGKTIVAQVWEEIEE